jgi:serine/threonine protein kinase
VERGANSGSVAGEFEQAVAHGALVGERYRLLEPLGEGGMGSVWRAHNEMLDIEVAIKVMRADSTDEESSLIASRMLQEARAAAKLIHPAIVRITDYGRMAAGHPYIVMDVLHGEDLETALRTRGRLGPTKAIQTLLPVVHALMHAHDKGVVHRDIKPENIFLCRNDDGSTQPKLIDFGVAKLEQQGNRRLTGVGAVMGSPCHMSPEQARGDDADERADIWSVCVVIYEMVTGDVPFDGKNYNAQMRAIIEDEPTSILASGVGDNDLWFILSKGLAKERDRRWQFMRQLGVALAEWLLDHGITADICNGNLATIWSRTRSMRAHEATFDTLPPPRPAMISAPPIDVGGGKRRSSRARSSTIPPTSQRGRTASQPPASEPPESEPPASEPSIVDDETTIDGDE